MFFSVIKPFQNSVISNSFIKTNLNKFLILKNYSSENGSKEVIPSGTVEFEYPKQKIFPTKDPFEVNVREMIESDFNKIVSFIKSPSTTTFDRDDSIYHGDIVVFGGGYIGTAIAYYLREKHGSVQDILVVDNDFTIDPTYGTTLLGNKVAAESLGIFKQQFSLLENIALAKFSADFFREINDHLGIYQDFVHLPYRPFGSLTIASEEGVDGLKNNHLTQNYLSVANEILTGFQISQRFPWLHSDDIVLGCLGSLNEGWIDPISLLSILRTRAKQIGVKFLQAEPAEFVYRDDFTLPLEGFYGLRYQPTNKCMLKMPNGEYKILTFGTGVLALGSRTPQFTKELLHMDEKYSGIFGIEVPIKRRKRYAFSFEARENGPGLSSPLIIDQTGLFVKRFDVVNYVCGMPPIPEEEPNADNLDVDYDFFHHRIWPILARRIPACSEIKLNGGYAYYIDQNTYDGNGLLSRLPPYQNIFIAAGFGINDIAFAPAIGKAVSELIYDGTFLTFEIERLSFNRILKDIVLFEGISLA